MAETISSPMSLQHQIPLSTWLYTYYTSTCSSMEPYHPICLVYPVTEIGGQHTLIKQSNRVGYACYITYTCVVTITGIGNRESIRITPSLIRSLIHCWIHYLCNKMFFIQSVATCRLKRRGAHMPTHVINWYP